MCNRRPLLHPRDSLMIPQRPATPSYDEPPLRANRDQQMYAKMEMERCNVAGVGYNRYGADHVGQHNSQ